MTFQFPWCRKQLSPAHEPEPARELKDGDIFNIELDVFKKTVDTDFMRRMQYLQSHKNTVQLIVERGELYYPVLDFNSPKHCIVRFPLYSGKKAVLRSAKYVGNMNELTVLIDQSKHVLFDDKDKVFIQEQNNDTCLGWCIRIGAVPNPALVLEKQYLEGLAQSLRKDIETSDASIKLKSVYEQLKKFDAKHG